MMTSPLRTWLVLVALGLALGMCVPAGAPGGHISFRDEAIRLAYPLARGLRAYWEATGGKCPESLQDLVPQFVDEIPSPHPGTYVTGWRYRRWRDALTSPPSCELVVIPDPRYLGWPPYVENPFTNRMELLMAWVYWPEETYPEETKPGAYFPFLEAYDIERGWWWYGESPSSNAGDEWAAGWAEAAFGRYWDELEE